MGACLYEAQDVRWSRMINDQIVQPEQGRPPGFLPTFIGIGSMRCGSTWLYEVLKCHPEIRVSKMKEVDFFFMRRMLSHDLRWYENLFQTNAREQPRPIRGEISPRYARLKLWQIRQISDLLPELRLVLILRHPIERLWSQTLYDFGHLAGRDIRTVGALAFMRQLERARSKLSSDYYRITHSWMKAFGKGALHIGFFEQLRGDPQAFVDGVLRHIGASQPWILPDQFAKKKVWSTTSLVQHERGIPEIIHWYMAYQLLPGTERLNRLLNGTVSNWVVELRDVAAQSRPGWRILREVNRALIALPERIAYESYHVFIDVRMRQRWHQLRRAYADDQKRLTATDRSLSPTILNRENGAGSTQHSESASADSSSASIAHR